MANKNLRSTPTSSISDALQSASNSGRKVEPNYNGKFLSRVGNQSTWHYKPTKVKLKDGRVIDIQPIAPWTVQDYSISRKVTKTAQTASSAVSSSAKKAKEFWPKNPRKRKGPKTPLDQYDIHMRAVRGAYNLPRNRNSTDIGPTLKSQLDEYAAFNKRAGRGGPHKLIPRTRYQYGYGMPFDEAPYRNSPSDGLRSKLLQSYAYRHGEYNFHK